MLAFPTLRADAGWEGALAPEAETVVLPGTFAPDQFPVHVAGYSMDGGAKPLRDGDWAIFAWARGQGIGAVEGKVALCGEGVEFHIKQVMRDAGA